MSLGWEQREKGEQYLCDQWGWDWGGKEDHNRFPATEQGM